MINKIRLKLTLINSVVLFSVLLFISVFVYITVNFDVINNTDQDLTDAAYQIKRYIPLLENSAKKSELAELSDEYTVFQERMDSSLISYVIWDEYGKTIFRNSNFDVDSKILSAIADSVFSQDKRTAKISEEPDGTYYYHVYNYTTTNIRVCTTILSDDSGAMRIIQTYGNMNQQNTMADRLLRILMLAALIGVTLSFLSGYLIAGRSIIPIQESMDRQKEFIADASHELRTPVTIVRTNLDVVKSSPDDSVRSQMTWINHAYEETGRMEKMISDLLFLAKADLNQFELSKTDIELNAFLETILEKFLPVAQQKKLAVRFKPCDNPLKIEGDTEKLHQLFFNIIENALNYSSKNETVSVTAIQANRRFAQIQIHNEGIGIDKEELDNIFERFYRTDKARTRRAGGTGLGLSIAKWIVDAHKGEIYAESEQSKGTTIFINLPLKEGE